MKLPDIEGAPGQGDRAGDWSTDGRYVIRGAGWRQDGTVQVGREQAVVIGACLEVDGCGGLTGQHLGAVEGPGPGADKDVAAIEVVEREVVGVGPDRQLGIVVEIDRADLKG